MRFSLMITELVLSCNRSSWLPSSPAGAATSTSPSESEATASTCFKQTCECCNIQSPFRRFVMWRPFVSWLINTSPEPHHRPPYQAPLVGETRSARSSGNQNQTHITYIAACSLSVVDCLPQQTLSRWQSWLCISSIAQRNLWMVVGTLEDKNWQWWSKSRKTISHLNELWHKQCWNVTYENPHCLENYC